MAAQTAQHAQDKLVGSVEAHKEEAKPSAVEQGAEFTPMRNSMLAIHYSNRYVGFAVSRYLQITHHFGRLGDQKDVFEHELEEEANEEVLQRLADGVLETAVLVLADLSLAQ